MIYVLREDCFHWRVASRSMSGRMACTLAAFYACQSKMRWCSPYFEEAAGCRLYLKGVGGDMQVFLPLSFRFFLFSFLLSQMSPLCLKSGLSNHLWLHMHCTNVYTPTHQLTNSIRRYYSLVPSTYFFNRKPLSIPFSVQQNVQDIRIGYIRPLGWKSLPEQ